MNLLCHFSCACPSICVTIWGLPIRFKYVYLKPDGTICITCSSIDFSYTKEEENHFVKKSMCIQFSDISFVGLRNLFSKNLLHSQARQD